MKSKYDNVALFYAFNFLLDFRPYWPVAILYFQGIAGSYALAMTVFSIVFISQSLLEIPTGMISDRIGRKKTLISGAFFSFCALSLYAAGFGFWCLACGAVCEGLSRALFSGTSNAFLYESLKEKGLEHDYGRVAGKANSMFQIGLSSSALFGSLLALHSLSLVLWVSVVPQFLCSLLCFLFHEAKHVFRSEEHIFSVFKSIFKQFKENQKLRLISMAQIIEFGFGESIFYFQAAFFRLVIPEWMIGIVRAVNHCCSALGAWYSGAVLKKFGYKNSLIGGNIISSLVQFLALFFPSGLSPFLIAGTSLNYGVSNTARTALLQKEFSDHQRATMDSLVSLSGSILFSVVSAVIGYLADVTNPAFAMMMALSSSIAVVLIYKNVFKDDL